MATARLTAEETLAVWKALCAAHQRAFLRGEDRRKKLSFEHAAFIALVMLANASPKGLLRATSKDVQQKNGLPYLRIPDTSKPEPLCPRAVQIIKELENRSVGRLSKDQLQNRAVPLFPSAKGRSNMTLPRDAWRQFRKEVGMAGLTFSRLRSARQLVELPHDPATSIAVFYSERGKLFSRSHHNHETPLDGIIVDRRPGWSEKTRDDIMRMFCAGSSPFAP